MNKKKQKKSHSQSPFHHKTLLLVNTGSSKKRFTVEKLHRLGITIVALNREKNWAENYVDHWILADTANHQESLAAVQTFIAHHPLIKIDGAITFWEDDVLLTSKIVDKFNLIGIPYATAKNVRNKFAFREFCEQSGLPFPRHKLLRSPQDILWARRHLSFPLVIKPAYGSSSSYVVKVNNEEELRDAYAYIKRSLSTQIESALSDGTDVLAEEYIDGDEVDIDMLIQNGRLKFFSLTDNQKTAEPFFVETGDGVPSSLPADDQAALVAMADETIEKLRIQNACIHFEAKMTKHGPVPIEVNMRMGGDQVYSYVKGAWGVDLVEYAARIALGIHFPKIVKPAEPIAYLASRYFLSEHSGILSQLDFAPEFGKNDKVRDVCFFKKIGDPVLTPPEGYEYMGWVTTTGDNMHDAEDNLEEALKMIHFEVARFHSTSSIGKTERKNTFSLATVKKFALENEAKIEKLRRVVPRRRQKIRVGVITSKKNGLLGKSLLSPRTQQQLLKKGFSLHPIVYSHPAQLLGTLRSMNVDFILNLATASPEIPFQHTMNVLGVLEVLKIPYTGSNLFTTTLAEDTLKMRKLLSFHEIPVAEWEFVYSDSDLLDFDLSFPVSVRAGTNVSFFENKSFEVLRNKSSLFVKTQKITDNFQKPAYFEELLEGKKYLIFVFGNSPHSMQALPLFEYRGGEKLQILVPRKLPKKLSSLMTEIAFDAFAILGCNDCALIEITVENGDNPYVTNVNPQPFNNEPAVALKILDRAGADYADLLEKIFLATIKRYREKPSPFYFS